MNNPHTVTHLQVTDTLQLRLLQEDDADWLYELVKAGQEYLSEWLPWVDTMRRPEDARRFIRTGLLQQEHDNGFQMGIFERQVLVGVVSFNYINWKRGRTELGYWLGEAYQGRGLMTMACRAMIDCAFRKLDLKRVEIRCAVSNSKSRAVAERLGFVEEGVSVQFEWMNDRYVDAVVYVMTDEHWWASRKEII
ncbi:MAG: GNAT family N-acetyltransferase [Anaerolineae bacterium]|nr:GNAT family N-acetyltransferase [Anaerolineae bacterium]